MADERDLELLDDYLTSRMSEQDRSAFEQKLKADPDLQHEYSLQKRLIQGIKDTRIAELKSMLNNVPVPAANTGPTMGTKIILGTVVSLMIVAVAFYYFRDDRTNNPARKAQEQQAPADKIVVPQINNEEKVEKEESTAPKKETIEDKNQTSAGTEHSKPSLAKKPDPLSPPVQTKEGPVLDVFTPDSDQKESAENNLDNDQPALTPGSSSLAVETDRNNRRYSFHYQFREGKLFLYGPFEKNLYEIMEFFTDDKRTVFLYYNDYYYLLQEADDEIKPLSPISDQTLIKKLRDYRSSK